MFCRECGRLLDDGETYCPVCGTINEKSDAVDAAEAQLDDGMKSKMAGQALKWGILSLVFADTGLLSLLGFIFSFTAKAKVNEYVRRYGRLEGRARVGHILGRVGFGLGLGLSIFFAICLAIIIPALALRVGGLM